MGEYESLCRYLEDLYINYEEDKPDVIKVFQEDLPQLKSAIELMPYCHNKVLLINAEAGMGKTHYMCAIAQRLSQRMNVYLLFGSKFDQQEDFELQFLKMSNLSNKSLTDLDEAMQQQNSNALFIVDAINEGATNVFWNTALKSLDSIISGLNNIRVIVTYRKGDFEPSNFLKNWEQASLNGYGPRVYDAVSK